MKRMFAALALLVAVFVCSADAQLNECSEGLPVITGRITNRFNQPNPGVLVRAFMTVEPFEEVWAYTNDEGYFALKHYASPPSGYGLRECTYYTVAPYTLYITPYTRGVVTNNVNEEYLGLIFESKL